MEPTLVAAACYATGSPFLNAAARREETMRHKFSMGADGDIATTIAAYTEWEHIKNDHGFQAAADWAYVFVSFFPPFVYAYSSLDLTKLFVCDSGHWNEFMAITTIPMCHHLNCHHC